MVATVGQHIAHMDVFVCPECDVKLGMVFAPGETERQIRCPACERINRVTRTPDSEKRNWMFPDGVPNPCPVVQVGDDY